MLTDRLGRLRFGSLRSLSPRRFRFSSSSDVTESEAQHVQSAPPVPAFQMEYIVSGLDTLERIAASHDCTVGELMKLNRMGSRMVFPGQKLIVPVPSSDDVFEQAAISGDGIRKGPGSAVPAQRGTLGRTGSAPLGSTDEADQDCLQRFLKIKVKQVTELDGTVSGTLLVTPNCLMFDPDVSHPLVKEKGQSYYIMVADMEDIMSVSVYKEIAALTGDPMEKKKDIFDPSHIRTKPSNSDIKSASFSEIEGTDRQVQSASIPVSFSCDLPDTDGVDSGSASDDQVDMGSSSKLGSESFLPSITEETKALDSPDDSGRIRAVSDISESVAIGRSLELEQDRSRSCSPNCVEERPRSFSELDAPAPQGISRFSPNNARRSFGKLGRTLSERAKSVHNSVAQSAEKVAQGTKSVAHGVVTHTRSAADTLQTGIESSVKAVGGAANAAATQAKNAVVSVPGKMVDMGTSFVSDSIYGVQDMFNVEEQRSPSQLKREQSLATLEGLKQRTQQARDSAARSKLPYLMKGQSTEAVNEVDNNPQVCFTCATSSEELPDLFAPVERLIGQQSDTTSAEPPQLPYYMAVRLTRKKRRQHRSSPTPGNSVSSYDEEVPFGNKLKREFWFAVPRNKADSIYHFLLQWSPEKYGKDTTATNLDESVTSSTTVPDSKQDERGFIVLDSTADEALSGEKPSSLFGSSVLNREWELVTVSEMCRRLSLDDLDSLELPTPEGASASQILDELMIRQMMEILPPRAEGYPWVNIYSSEKHGFSLATLYRKMTEFDEDLSPVLLIIRDTKDHVFGAVVSGAIRPSDHYSGTGDSCLLWRFTGVVPHTRDLRHFAWTGDNQFFVNAAKDSLSIGAGGGHYGLWLDADLNHGRSERCDTFNNEPLAGEKEDFIIQFIEAFGFRM